MRAVLQRVARAEVQVDGGSVGRIGPGLVILLGVGHDDTEAVAEAFAVRISRLRIFGDDTGRTERSILDAGGAALVVSQFTLYADTRRGRRPGYSAAADPVVAERCYSVFAAALERVGIVVATGRFGAHMTLELVNDGPFTIWLDSSDGSAGPSGRP